MTRAQLLVDEAIGLDVAIKSGQVKLKEHKAELITYGAGDIAGELGKAIVVVPAAAIKPDEAAVEAAREFLEPEHFKKLFEEKKVMVPVKSFREIAGALLTKPKARKLIALCEVTGESYVKLVPHKKDA